MHIAIEGCDGTGKTVIARELEKQGWKYIHESRPNNFDYYKNVVRIIEGGRNCMVADRWCLGQFVYNKKQERKLALSELGTVLKDTTLVYVYADPSLIYKNTVKRDGEFEIPFGVGWRNPARKIAMEKQALRWITKIQKRYMKVIRYIRDYTSIEVYMLEQKFDRPAEELVTRIWDMKYDR